MVKDLQIFKDYKSKNTTNFPNYDNSMPMFQGFISNDNDNDKKKSLQNSDKG